MRRAFVTVDGRPGWGFAAVFAACLAAASGFAWAAYGFLSSAIPGMLLAAYVGWIAYDERRKAAE